MWSYVRTFHKTFMNKLVSLSSRPISHRTPPTINTPDTCTILVESRLSNLNIQNLRQDLSRLSEKDQRLELKHLESKSKSFKLLLNFWWERFRTDRSFLRLIFKCHFHHTSKSLIVSKVVIWRLLEVLSPNMKKSSVKIKIIHWSCDSSIPFLSLASKN